MTGGRMNTSVRKDSPVIKTPTWDLENLTQVTASETGFLGELRYSLQPQCCEMIVKILPSLSGCLGCIGCNFFGWGTISTCFMGSWPHWGSSAGQVQLAGQMEVPAVVSCTSLLPDPMRSYPDAQRRQPWHSWAGNEPSVSGAPSLLFKLSACSGTGHGPNFCFGQWKGLFCPAKWHLGQVRRNSSVDVSHKHISGCFSPAWEGGLSDAGL